MHYSMLYAMLPVQSKLKASWCPICREVYAVQLCGSISSMQASQFVHCYVAVLAVCRQARVYTAIPLKLQSLRCDDATAGPCPYAALPCSAHVRPVSPVVLEHSVCGAGGRRAHVLRFPEGPDDGAAERYFTTVPLPRAWPPPPGAAQTRCDKWNHIVPWVEFAGTLCHYVAWMMDVPLLIWYNLM